MKEKIENFTYGVLFIASSAVIGLVFYLGVQ